MKFRAAFLSLCLLALTQINGFSQSPTPSPSPTPTAAKTEAQKELEKRVIEMIDQAVSDAAALKVAQNRAVVYALAGDLLWQFDEKTARQLFRNSINELVTSNIEKEKEKKERDDPDYGFFEIDSGLRGEILPIIAKHDAGLALEGLVQTRPTKLIEAMARASAPAAKRNTLEFNPDTYQLKNELALEQKFAVLVAEQDPDAAIKLLKNSLSKGITRNVKSLLDKIYTKDPKKASSLADDVVSRIEDMDLSKDIDELGSIVNLFQQATNPNTSESVSKKKFSFSNAQLKKIAGKLARTLYESDTRSIRISATLTYLVDDLERVLPEQSASLRQKQSEITKALPLEYQQVQQQRKIWNPNSTPEEILAELPKVSEFARTSGMQMLIPKIAAIEDDARAKKLIEQIPDEKAREQAREQYEAANIGRMSEAGKLDDARKLISNLTKKKTQIQKLVSLAIQFHQKGTEKDKEIAAGLIKDAKAMVNDFPEDEDELNDLMELILGYAIVSPNDGFRLFEPLVDQINDYLQASAILSKYNKDSETFKKGELMLRMGDYSWGQLLFRCSRQMETLGKADLHRMALITDKFQRADARIFSKLLVVKGFLKDDKKAQEEMTRRGSVVFMDGGW